MPTDKYQEQLLAIAIFLQNKPLNLKFLNPDFRAMLIKKTKDQRRVGWTVNKGNYSKWKVRQFLQSLQQVKIYKLEFVKNYEKNVLKHIYHIKFTKLQFLVIQWAWMNNLQILSYLDAPILRQINLKNNQFAQLKSLRKLISPNVKVLRLNLHKSISNFSEYNNYNRHTFLIARELLKYHNGSVFGEKMKKVLNRRCPFYPIDKDKDNSSDSSDSQ